tara:strand:+ start:1416 stop:2297 length:882 start_codon:yes stop_codon:yes gene_type:complete
MAWKFKQELVRDGDVVEPSEFRININEYASEINGYLDSDNVGKNSITISDVKRDSFTEVIGMYTNLSNSYIFNHEESGWQKEAHQRIDSQVSSPMFYIEPLSVEDMSTGTKPYEDTAVKGSLPRCEFDSDQDGLIICEFSGWVQWLQSSSHPEYIQSTSGYTSTDNEYWAPTYSYFAKQNKWFKLSSAYILCSMWRITVNGQSVAETGPLGNEYDSHPIYLCGTTPVVKSKDNIAQLEARFVWYSPGRNHFIEASGWAPRGVSGTTIGEDSTLTWRRDCTLHSPSMHVIYRKR